MLKYILLLLFVQNLHAMIQNPFGDPGSAPAVVLGMVVETNTNQHRHLPNPRQPQWVALSILVTGAVISGLSIWALVKYSDCHLPICSTEVACCPIMRDNSSLIVYPKSNVSQCKNLPECSGTNIWCCTPEVNQTNYSVSSFKIHHDGGVGVKVLAILGASIGPMIALIGIFKSIAGFCSQESN